MSALQFRTLTGGVLLLLGMILPTQAAGETVSQQVARVYARSAYELMQQNELAAAAELSRRALRYAQDSSDAHAVLGYVAREQNAVPAVQIEHLRNALEGSGVQLFSERGLRIDLSRLLLQTDQLEPAREVLPQLSATGVPDHDLLTAWARVRLVAGSDADRLIREGLQLYPDSDELVVLMLQQETVPDFFTRSYVEHALQQSPRYREALLRLIELQPDAAVVDELFARYFALGGRSVRGRYLYLLHALEQDAPEDDVLQRMASFREAGGLQRWDMLHTLFERGLPGYLADALESELAGFNQTVYWHKPYRSQPSQWLEMRNGDPLRWFWDRNLDGIADREVGFIEGVPADVLLRRHSGSTLRFSYHFYPWVIGYERQQEASTLYYSLVPFTMELAVFETLPIESPQGWVGIQLPQPDMNLTAQASDEQVRSVRETTGDGDERITYYYNRLPARVELADPATGVYAITEYQDGLPFRRSESLSRDGYFDAVEIFDEGRLLARAYDTSRDGSADHWEYTDKRGARVWLLHNDPRIGAIMPSRFSSAVIVDILKSNETENPLFSAPDTP